METIDEMVFFGYEDPKITKLKNVFSRRKKALPPFGAINAGHMLNLKNSLKRKIIFLFSISLCFFISVFIFFMMSRLYVEGALTCMALAIIVAVIKIIFDIDNDEIIILLTECKDVDTLNKVVIAAKSSVAVEQQLKLLANSDRDYLCWYEVFTLLAIAEKDFQNSALQEAKGQIAQMVNQSTELVRTTDLVRPFELK